MLPDTLPLFVCTVVLEVSNIVSSLVPPREAPFGLEERVEHILRTVLWGGRKRTSKGHEWPESPMTVSHEGRRDRPGIDVNEREVRVLPGVVLTEERISA